MSAQICSGEWTTQPERWKKSFITLTNVRIIRGKFYSKETEGRFVTFFHEDKKVYGLCVQKPWSVSLDKGQWEVGERVGPLADYYAGKYAQASYKLLRPAELTQYSREQLAIMRNELFARYGYAFTKNEKMHLYFKKQEWYQVEQVALDLVLTPVEKRNLVTLRVAEAQAALAE